MATRIFSPPYIHSTGNRAEWIILATPNWRAIDGFHVLCTIEVEDVWDSGLFRKLVDFPATPGADDKVVFDTSAILAGVAVHTSPVFLDANSVEHVGDAQKRFQISFRERQADGTVLSTLYYANQQAVAAAHPPTEFLIQKMLNGEFFTSQQGVVDSTPFAPQWLTFCARGAGDYDVVGEIILDDGTTDTVVRDSWTATKWGVYRIPAGWRQLKLHTRNNTLGAVGYRVYIQNSVGFRVSEIQEYRFDSCACSDLTRYFVVANGWGGLDTVITKDAASSEVEESFEEAELLPTPGLPWQHQRLLVRYGTKKKEVVEQRIGAQTESLVRWLRSLDWEYAWRVGDSSKANPTATGIRYPIRIKELNFPLDDSAPVQAISFTYSDATHAPTL